MRGQRSCVKGVNGKVTAEERPVCQLEDLQGEMVTAGEVPRHGLATDLLGLVADGVDAAD